MSKKHMSHPEQANIQQPNDVNLNPKIYGKVKGNGENAISNAYPVIDNDLARDNLENDIPVADLQDL